MYSLYRTFTQVPLGGRVGLPEPAMTTSELTTLVSQKLTALPFFVERTKDGRGLPVYSDTKSGGTRKLTIIRRIYGDIDELGKMIEKEFPDTRKIDIKPEQQKIVLKGHLVDEIKLFLTNIGF